MSKQTTQKQPSKLLVAVDFKTLTLKARFQPTKGTDGIMYAPISWGSPNFTHGDIDRDVFRKMKGERKQIKEYKKEIGVKTKGYKFTTLVTLTT